MTDAVIVSTARTPIGKAYRGAFNNTHGADMGGHVISHAVKRAGVEPAEVEDVILGCALPEGATGQNIARQAALRAGLPVTTAGMTVNRFCSSGMQAIALAAQRVIVDKVTGFLVRPGEIGSAADAVSRASRLSRAECRAHATGHLDLERSLDAHEQLYRHLSGAAVGAALRG